VSKNSNVRAAAARCLAPLMRQQASLSEHFEESIASIVERDRPLFHELCYGTLRYFHKLEAIAARLLEKNLRAKDSDVKALLLIGLHQLIHLRTPDHAAISESVSATKALKKPWAKGLINASLRRFTREQDDLLTTLENNDDYRFSHPSWLVEAIKLAWPEHYKAILEANNLSAPLCLRVNEKIISRHDYLASLKDKSIEAAALANQQGLRLTQRHEITSLPGFNKGWFAVQDEAAQYCAEFLKPQDGDKVLDACAAPGGKSAHLLERAKIDLSCLELDPKRMRRVEENLQRLGHQAKLIVGDASRPELWWDGKPFDRILLDAPCSATGVIRRHPDIKLLRRESDISELARIQSEILTASWSLLRCGGYLLYATCSILPEENDHRIQAFLDTHKDAELVAIPDVGHGLSSQYGRQLFPAANGHDGFYYSLLKKH
jgi:16S rRNA (cytosine967-C5)-methyltransferase